MPSSSLDLKNREVYRLPASYMAAYFSTHKRAIYAEEAIKHYQRLIKNQDYEYYLKLMSQASKDKNEPQGFIIEAK